MGTTVEFLTNDNVITVVSAYLKALDDTPFSVQVDLIQKVIRDSPLKKREISRMTGIPVTRLYEYNRKDWVERHTNCYPANPIAMNVLTRDFVALMRLANSLSS